MGKHTAVRVLPRLTSVFRHIGLCKHIAVLVQDLASHDPFCVGILPRIVWTADDIPAFYHVEICNISHKNKEQTHECVGDSSELFVSGALCLFPVLVGLVGFFSVSAGHLTLFLVSF